MTIFDQFRRENSNAFRIFSPLKIINFASKIEIDHFSKLFNNLYFLDTKWTFDTL